MPARTTLLIIFLTLFTSALVVYSLVLDSNQTTSPSEAKTVAIPTITPVVKNASYTFDPATVTLSSLASASGKTNVILNASSNRVTDVQVELSYDPKVLQNVTLATPSSSFWQQTGADYQELYKNVDPVNGRISYIASIKQHAKPVTGVGPILTISYRINPRTFSTGTSIKMLDKSLVMQDGTNESVLGQMHNFSIISAFPTKPVITLAPINASSSGYTVTPTTPK